VLINANLVIHTNLFIQIDQSILKSASQFMLALLNFIFYYTYNNFKSVKKLIGDI